MIAGNIHTRFGRIGSAVLPSSTSGIVCGFAGIATVGVAVLQDATKQGTSLEGIRVGASGAIPIVTSLDHLLSRASLHDVVLLLLWAVAGAAVAGLLEFLLGMYAGRKDGESSAALRRPERQWLLRRAYWRLGVGVASIIVALLLVRSLHWASATEKNQVALLQVSLKTTAGDMALAAVLWAVTYQVIISASRLYTRRTRLFGGKPLFPLD